MSNLKGYTARKNGRNMKTRRIAFHLDEEAVAIIMERNGCSQAAAEKKLIEAMLSTAAECVGLAVSEEGEVTDSEHAGCFDRDGDYIRGTDIEAPIVVI